MKGNYNNQIGNAKMLITFIAVLGVSVALTVMVHRGTSRHICDKEILFTDKWL